MTWMCGLDLFGSA